MLVWSCNGQGDDVVDDDGSCKGLDDDVVDDKQVGDVSSNGQGDDVVMLALSAVLTLSTVLVCSRCLQSLCSHPV